MRAPALKGRTLLIASRSGSASTASTPIACWPKARPIAASALPSNWRPSARRQPRRIARRCIPGAVARFRPRNPRRAPPPGEPFAVRLRIPDHPLRFHDLVRGAVEFPSETVSDPILVRSSGMPVYNYVVTLDDALMEITHVIRGDDHISNTPKQVAIYEAFGWKPPEFAHLSTILGSDRERLSKRHGATSVASFREMGILPEALVNYLALLGWGAEGGTREIFSLEELVREFRLERVTASPAVFDWEKLHWLNRHYLKAADPERIAELAWPHFIIAGFMPATEGASPAVKAWFGQLLALFLPAVNQLDELPAKAGLVFHFDPAAARADDGERRAAGEPNLRKKF